MNTSQIFKKIVPILILVILIVVTLTSSLSPDTSSSEIQVDDISFLPILLVAGSTWLVTNGIKSASREWGIDISGRQTQLTASLVLGLYSSINWILSLIPSQYTSTVLIIIGGLSSIFAAFGIAEVSKKFSPKG